MVQQIRGNTQVIAGTLTSTQLNSAAGITDGQLASSYLYANGTRALSGALSMGTNQLNNLSNGTVSTDAVNLGQVQALIEGIQSKVSARCATNTESLTIASGTATGITGLTVDGVTVAIGDTVLVANAPASTGACGGTTLSSEPANGLYTVTGITTNITMSRSTDMAGSIGPFGTYVFVVTGTVWAAAGLAVTTPSSEGAFTYGTGNNIAFTQWSGAAELTLTSPLGKSGNTISINSMATGTVILGDAGTPTITALSGDVTVGATGTVTIAAGAVTLAKHANLAANSVIGNTTGSSATPTAVAITSLGSTTPAATTIAEWDANSNLSANAVIPGFATQAASATTLTLTIGSAQTQVITTSGTQTQLIKLPTTGIVAGMPYTIINQSNETVTVESSGANTICTLAGSASAPYTAATLTAMVNTPTTAGNWNYTIYSTGAGAGTVTAVSVVTANGFEGSVATSTSTPAITIQSNVTAGLLASSGAGGSIQAATGANITAHLSQNETPSGTINGSTTAFTLAHTQVTGTEQVFLNGLLSRAGGVDYTATAGTITFVTAPASGDSVLVSYWF